MEAVTARLAAALRGRATLARQHRAVATEQGIAHPETAEETRKLEVEVADRPGSHRMFQRGQILPVPPDHLNLPLAS